MGIVVLVSFVSLGIYISFGQGMIFGWARIAVANKLDKWIGVSWSRYVQKPLWECFPCMARVWSIILTERVDVFLILAVSGLNFLIEKTFVDEGNS